MTRKSCFSLENLCECTDSKTVGLLVIKLSTSVKILLIKIRQVITFENLIACLVPCAFAVAGDKGVGASLDRPNPLSCDRALCAIRGLFAHNLRNPEITFFQSIEDLAITCASLNERDKKRTLVRAKDSRFSGFEN